MTSLPHQPRHFLRTVFVHMWQLCQAPGQQWRELALAYVATYLLSHHRLPARSLRRQGRRMPHQHERVAVGLGLALHCYTAAARAAPAGLDRTQNRSAALHCLQELLAPATATLGICVRGLGVTALQLRIPTSRDAASTRLTSLFCCCWKLRMTSTPGSTIQSGCGVTGTSISYHARICPLPPPPANA